MKPTGMYSCINYSAMEIHKVTIRRHRDRKEIMAEEILVLLEFYLPTRPDGSFPKTNAEQAKAPLSEMGYFYTRGMGRPRRLG
jgi:hypothetical protein